MVYRGSDVRDSILAAILLATFLAGCGPAQGPDAKPAVDSVGVLPSRSAGVVEVLNGTGRKGAATRIAERLRAQGYDVVKIGNAPERNHARTIVAERRAAPHVAEGVAKAIGVPSFFSFHNENLLVDATVFVGRDFEEITPQ